MAAATWQDWAVGTLAGIKAPYSLTNIATLRGWSTREKGYWPSIQWCNPLNTTEPWPGAYDSGAQPGAHDVKVYASLSDGIAATVTTLIGEPYYPGIVDALRDSLPTLWWPSTTRSELDTWGTGQSWLDAVPLAADVTAQLDKIAAQVDAIYKQGVSPTYTTLDARLKATLDAIAAIPGGAAPDLTQLKADVAGIKADVAEIRMRVDKDLAP